MGIEERRDEDEDGWEEEGEAGEGESGEAPVVVACGE